MTGFEFGYFPSSRVVGIPKFEEPSISYYLLIAGVVIYIIIIIIIIMSCRQHGYPWPSLATSPYYSSPLAGLQGYILCPHTATVLLLGHMWGSTGIHHLWARPCFPAVSWVSGSSKLYSFRDGVGGNALNILV